MSNQAKPSRSKHGKSELQTLLTRDNSTKIEIPRNPNSRMHLSSKTFQTIRKIRNLRDKKNQLGISGLEFRLPQFADLNLFFPILFFFKAASFLGVQ